MIDTFSIRVVHYHNSIIMMNIQKVIAKLDDGTTNIYIIFKCNSNLILRLINIYAFQVKSLNLTCRSCCERYNFSMMIVIQQVKQVNSLITKIALSEQCVCFINDYVSILNKVPMFNCLVEHHHHRLIICQLIISLRANLDTVVI